MELAGFARVLAERGRHQDGWCRPEAGLEIRADADILLMQMQVWIKPERGHPALLRIAIEGRETFEAAVPEDVVTTLQIGCLLRRGDAAAVAISCDRRVDPRGDDQRELSFILTSLTFT